ncbi:unnamed protein product [Mytilus coruscus]|uniref:Reverse transcriptase domain-containing protein n=1 Tax=Mytilus coruscus TaxID=42192 RepID=A0A6J8CN61_MYTCO|nr:unnamed protein product [Mytilus coruscus]
MKVICDNVEILPKNLGNNLALYEEIYENDNIGKIIIPNHHPIIIPAGSVQIIQAQTKPAPIGQKLDYIVEEDTRLTMPNGFALASSLESVTEPDGFHKSEDDIGFCNKIEHHIPTTDNIPVKIPHRRIPPNQWSEVREYLQNALKLGVIQASSSPYSAPVVIIPRKKGKLRMCVDFRGLNSKTRKDAYPLPRIEEALDAFYGTKYFCSLDLVHGFHQLPVGTGGLYQYLRMPFGLTGSPGTFMLLMDKIFGNQNFQTILTYLDDILVFGRDFNETLESLEIVLSSFKANNLKIRPEKCQLFKEQLRYLGHLISERGMALDDVKIKAITDWQKPKTDSE